MNPYPGGLHLGTDLYDRLLYEAEVARRCNNYVRGRDAALGPGGRRPQAPLVTTVPKLRDPSRRINPNRPTEVTPLGRNYVSPFALPNNNQFLIPAANLIDAQVRTALENLTDNSTALTDPSTLRNQGSVTVPRELFPTLPKPQRDVLGGIVNQQVRLAPLVRVAQARNNPKKTRTITRSSSDSDGDFDLSSRLKILEQKHRARFASDDEGSNGEFNLASRLGILEQKHRARFASSSSDENFGPFSQTAKSSSSSSERGPLGKKKSKNSYSSSGESGSSQSEQAVYTDSEATLTVNPFSELTLRDRASVLRSGAGYTKKEATRRSKDIRRVSQILGVPPLIRSNRVSSDVDSTELRQLNEELAKMGVNYPIQISDEEGLNISPRYTVNRARAPNLSNIITNTVDENVNAENIRRATEEYRVNKRQRLAPPSGVSIDSLTTTAPVMIDLTTSAVNTISSTFPPSEDPDRREGDVITEEEMRDLLN